MRDAVLVLDVGGTKLAAAVLLADNSIVCRQETTTAAGEGAAAIFTRLIALASAVLVEFAQTFAAAPPPTAVGLASAGYINPATGVVLFATENLPGWTGLPLAEKLTSALALPAAAANDGACFALAEATLGAGAGFDHVLVVTVGTGVGGGIIINRQLYAGWQGRAGAIGHFCVATREGRACTCGAFGCLEAYTATPFMLGESGYDSIQELAQYYVAGNEEPAVEQSAIWLGRGLAGLAHVLGPEAIVIGGSVGLLGERYLKTVRNSMAGYAMPIYRATPVLAAQLGADGGLVGAGLFARSQLTTDDR